MSLIYYHGEQIKRLSNNFKQLKIVQLPLDLPIDGLAVDSRRGLVYASNAISGTIHRVSLDNGERIWVKVMGQPGPLALDWLTGNLYFADNMAIRVCHLDDKRCAPIIVLPGDVKVNTIVVDALERFVGLF